MKVEMVIETVTGVSKPIAILPFETVNFPRRGKLSVLVFSI